MTPILQMGKLRLREVRSLAQGHPPEVVRLAPCPFPCTLQLWHSGCIAGGALLSLREGEVGGAGNPGLPSHPRLTHSPLPATPSSVPHVRLGQRRPHHPGRVSKCKVCSRAHPAGPGASTHRAQRPGLRPELTVCLPRPAGGRGAAVGEPAHREGVGALHRRRRHDGGGQRLRGADGEGPGPLSPPSTLCPPSPARSESALLEGLEGRDRPWPARHSNWAWRRAPLRDLAAFLSHQKTRTEVPVLGGRAGQGRLGLGGRRPYWVASLGPQ